jgi:hypothetical protein
MNHTNQLYAACALVACATAACGSMNTFKTPTVLAPGAGQILVATQIHGASAAPNMTAPMPELVAGYRRGIAQSVELGITGTALPLGSIITSVSVEGAAKYHLFERGRWQASVGAAIGYRLTTSSSAAFELGYASVPLMIGAKVGQQLLVVSPQVSYQRVYSTGARPVVVPAAGFSVGAVLRLSKRWSLLPELSWQGSATPNLMDGGSDLFHVGVAVLVDR